MRCGGQLSLSSRQSLLLRSVNSRVETRTCRSFWAVLTELKYIKDRQDTQSKRETGRTRDTLELQQNYTLLTFHFCLRLLTKVTLSTRMGNLIYSQGQTTNTTIQNDTIQNVSCTYTIQNTTIHNTTTNIFKCWITCTHILHLNVLLLDKGIWETVL